MGWEIQQFNKISYLVVVGALEVLSDSLDEDRFEEDREQSDWNHERLEQQNNGTECLQHNTHILDYCKPRQCLWCCHHDESHCESSPGSSDECRHPASQRGPPARRRLGLRVRRKLAATVHIHHRHCYYYSARKPILILPSHGGRKAEST